MSKRFENVEILAPVGGSEQLIAAVRCGANAVYLGAKGFNARRGAENFDSATALQDAVSYCHARNVRVHVTFNTLITDEELDRAEETLRAIAESGADALIIQDLAVAEMARRRCPDMPMHASTQMAVHNVSGVRALERLGFSRVVLARELTLEEIRKICDSTDMEVESFVHGALCMSASGLCGLSAMIGGRSGNRGLCAQPCRLDFRCRGRDHVLSLKDMSYIKHIDELANAGICSLKIEGRMKRPEYVAAAVTACRSALCGEAYDEETLRAVFSRGGFTNGYLTGRRTLDMFGYRTKEDVAAGQGVLKELAGLYRSELQTVPVDMELCLSDGLPSSLVARSGEAETHTLGALPEKAHTVAMNSETAAKSLGRTGGTQFYLRAFKADIGEGLTIAQAELNRMRREALGFLSQQLEAPAPRPFEAAVRAGLPAHRAAETPGLRLRFESFSQYFENDAELIIFPISEIVLHSELIAALGKRLAAELPAICYSLREDKLRAALEKLRALGLTEIVAETVYAVELGTELGFNIHGGMFLNALNSVSLSEYAKLGLEDITVSFELSMARLRALRGNIARGIVGYGYLPLMKLRACPVQGEKGCGGCAGVTTITDRKNESFTVICREKQYSELLNCVALYIGDKPISGADFVTLYFTTESARQCADITELFLSGESAPFRHTRGLFYRELL